MARLAWCLVFCLPPSSVPSSPSDAAVESEHARRSSGSHEVGGGESERVTLRYTYVNGSRLGEQLP